MSARAPIAIAALTLAALWAAARAQEAPPVPDPAAPAPFDRLRANGAAPDDARREAEELAGALALLAERPAEARDRLAPLAAAEQGAQRDEALYWLARAYEALGERDAARAALDRLLARAPDHPRADDALRRYQALAGAAWVEHLALDSPRETWRTLCRLIREGRYEDAYDCCGPRLRRAVGPGVLARACERSRGDLLAARLEAVPGDDTHWRAVAPDGRVWQTLPFEREGARWLLSVDFGE